MKVNPPSGETLPVIRVNGHFEFELPNGSDVNDRTVDPREFSVHLDSGNNRWVAERRTPEVAREEDLWSG